MLVGPFPGPADTPAVLAELARARELLVKKLDQEDMVWFVDVAKRFGDERGVNQRLLGKQGLTVRGSQILRREVNQFLDMLSHL